MLYLVLYFKFIGMKYDNDFFIFFVIDWFEGCWGRKKKIKRWRKWREEEVFKGVYNIWGCREG